MGVHIVNLSIKLNSKFMLILDQLNTALNTLRTHTSNRVIQSVMLVCPKQGVNFSYTGWGMVARLSLLNMAHTVFSNPRSETFAGLQNTLKLCKSRVCVFRHFSETGT